MKGYKVFNPDWTCRGFQFEAGKTFEEDIKSECCKSGFHFCTKLADCFNSYSFNPNNKVAEVEALGVIDKGDNGSKCCTNKIRIVRELSWHEVLELVNTGDWNAGNRNTGYGNAGNRNAGNCNTGDRNAGYSNAGNWNTGNRNTGNGNAGNWNAGDGNVGCFNTITPNILLFNRPSNWTYGDWVHSKGCLVMGRCPHFIKWVYSEDMTDEEKEKHPEHEVTGGFLKKTDSSERQEWWDNLSEADKQSVMSLPNFDRDIFREITGITV